MPGRRLVPILVALFLFSLSGCLDGATDPENDPPVPSNAGTVAGFAIQTESGLAFVDDPANGPAGSSPLAAGDLTLRNLAGETVVRSTLAADGSFSVEVPVGFGRLELVSGAGVSQRLEQDFTAVAGVITPIGRGTAVDRSQAVAAAMATTTAAPAASDPASWFVLATMQPIPPGVAIEPHASRGSGVEYTTASHEWFVFLDKNPEALYAHEVEYVFVNAATGAVRRVSGVTATPVLNGHDLWLSPFDYFVYGAWPTGNDLDPIPDDLEITAGPEVVQIPILSGAPAHVSPPRAITARPEPQEDVFALIVRGGKEDAFVANVVNFYQWLLDQGVPTRNIDLTTFPGRPLAQGFTEWNSDRTRIFKAVEDRLAAGGKPTLIVYVTGHGYQSQETGLPYGDVELAGSDDSRGFGAGNLTLDKATSACRIVVLWEACFSEILAEDTLIELGGLVPSERPDLQVYSASRRLAESFAYRQYHEVLSGGRLKMGGLFTNAWIANVTIVNGDIAGYLDPNGVPVPAVRQMETLTGKVQNPVRLHLPGNPAHCQPPPLVSLDQDRLRLVRGNAGACPGLVGTVVVSNTSEETVTWSTSSDGPLATNPSTGTLDPGASQSVDVFFDCSDFTSGEAVVTFLAQGPEIATTTVLTVDLEFTVTPGSAGRDFTVRHPSPLNNTEITMWLSIPDGAVVDSSRITDTTTGEEPPAVPWAPASALTWNYSEGFRPGFTSWFGIELVVPNPSPFDCACPALEWNYTFWYSFPMRNR